MDGPTYGALLKSSWIYRVADSTQVSQHGLNSLFALIELTLPATMPLPWLHLAFLIVILLLYLVVAYITRATAGFYPYSFLDPSKGRGRVTAYAFAIAAAIVVIFLVVRGAIWLRRRFTGPGKRSRERAGRRDMHSDVELIRVGMK